MLGRAIGPDGGIVTSPFPDDPTHAGMDVNAWLEDRSLAEQAVLGGALVAVLTFGLNYSTGIAEATVSALVSAVVVGTAYYIGLRLFNA